jgi:type III pantothenate kinase
VNPAHKSTAEFLLIDAGNTKLKWATAPRLGPVRVIGKISTATVTAAWIQSLARDYPTQSVAFSCVVPKLVPLFRKAFSKRIQVVNGKSAAVRLAFKYPTPSELGADRLAAAVAAHASGLYPSIIVACGTATAFTVLDPQGRLCGGAIAPGLKAQLAALIGATAQLPNVVLRPPRNPLARSTQEAIRSGVLLNFQGGIKEIIRQLGHALPGTRKPHIFLTGGNSRHLLGKLDQPYKLRPLLVLEGLHIIATRLFKPAA